MRGHTLRIERDERGVASLIFDRTEASVNTIDARFTEEFTQAVEHLEAEKPRGVILRSAKSSFFAGGDLDMIFETGREDAGELFAMVERLKASMRRLETSGFPVVACITGAALGGGWELALGCHHRILLDAPQVKIGLPEVTLGLLPGGGGVARTVRLFGLEAALPLLTEGRRYGVKDALKLGLAHESAPDQDAMIDQAHTWIDANPEVKQPWDERGYRMPGGAPSSPKLALRLAAAPAMMFTKTRGLLPAPETILSAMVEGALVDFETACRVESRHFVSLVCHPISKNFIQTFWYHLNEIKAGVGRPPEVPKRRVEKIGVLGAGMMGAGIAYSAAKSGVEVVLRDLDLERAERGKGYSQKLCAKQVTRGRMSEERAEALLGLIHPSADLEALSGCELVIEAVFEDRELKARVTQEAEAQLGPDALLASNTSTLPITGLAEATAHPERFIGLHFFSPVDKMQLVEIICGAQTSPESLARAYDFVLQLGKTPIVVNDSRGFFTSRVFGTYTQEGIAMLGEGVAPSLIERAAALAGFPVSPLAVSDEVSLTLMAKIRAQTERDLQAMGQPAPQHPAHRVIDTMLKLGRAGRAEGAGFYEYPTSKKKHLWSGLADHFPLASTQPPLDELRDRLLYIMAVETARCLEEGVLMSERDANIGSIFGIGFPAWTGGTARFVTHTGVERFVRRADELAARYGDRFTPPEALRSDIERIGS